MSLLERLEELEKRVHAAPWIVDKRRKSVVKPEAGIDWVCNCQISNTPNFRENAEFIAATRNALPTLLAEIRRLQQALGYAMGTCVTNGPREKILSIIRTALAEHERAMEQA